MRLVCPCRRCVRGVAAFAWLGQFACGLVFGTMAQYDYNAHVEGDDVRASVNSSNGSTPQVAWAFGIGFDIRTSENAELPVAGGVGARQQGRDHGPPASRCRCLCV